MKTKVLLDTDIGSDIDDAVALAWLLANKDCELVGITTVTGEADKRAQLASALCRAAGRAVPIFPGCELPLHVSPKQVQAPQAAALSKWAHEASFPANRAVHFMQETIRANPGEIVLLTIGPLTNVAVLYAMDPDVPRLVKAVVSMCGMFQNKTAGWGPVEWNASLDPHAAAIVYGRTAAPHWTVGLDVTSRLALDMSEIRRRFRGALLEPVLDFAEAWFRHRDHVVFHDPLAAAVVFDETLCTFVRGTVDVELESSWLAGAMRLLVNPAAGRHQVAVAVDRDRFFERYFSVFD